MDNLLKHLRILWRTERLLAEIEFKDRLRKTGLVACAVLALLVALAMINMAIFIWLQAKYGGVTAALVLAGGNTAIALAIVAVAGRDKQRPEVDMVREVRNLALSEVEEEVQSMQDELASMRDDVRDVTRSVKGFASNPLGSIGPGIVMPLVTTLAKSLGASKD
jgi:hypothetical protein